VSLFPNNDTTEYLLKSTHDRLIVEAVMVERERCTKIADGHVDKDTLRLETEMTKDEIYMDGYQTALTDIEYYYAKMKNR
jgi:hypothetical protein